MCCVWWAQSISRKKHRRWCAGVRASFGGYFNGSIDSMLQPTFSVGVRHPFPFIFASAAPSCCCCSPFSHKFGEGDGEEPGDVLGCAGRRGCILNTIIRWEGRVVVFKWHERGGGYHFRALSVQTPLPITTMFQGINSTYIVFLRVPRES